MANANLGIGDLVVPRSSNLTKYIDAEVSRVHWEKIRIAMFTLRAGSVEVKREEPRQSVGIVVLIRMERNGQPLGRPQKHKPYHRMAKLIYVRWLSGPLSKREEKHHTHDLTIISKASRKGK